MTIRSKHDNLLNYFIHDDKDLSKKYVENSEKFLEEFKNKKVIDIYKKVNNISNHRKGLKNEQ